MLGTAGGAAFLAGAFTESGQPRRPMIVGAVALLLVTGLLVLFTASGSGYSALIAVHELIVATVVALVGAIVLVLKPPVARRIAALLLVTAYPLLLSALVAAGNWLATGTPPIRFV